jgi:putative phage-type endonuclease
MNKVKVIPTWNMTSEDWLNSRDKGIGGSDAGTIVGVNKYKSAYALWAEKSGLIGRQGAGDAAKWGNRLERVVAEAYAEDYDKAVVSWPVILVSQEPGLEFMLANLDFLIVEPSDMFPAGRVTDWYELEYPDNVEGILEVKTSGIASPGTSHLWANNSIPESYRLQTVHYGVVTGIHNIHFAALLGGQGLITRQLTWDDRLAEDLIAAETMFWDMVVNQVAPPVDGSDATESALQSLYPRHIEGKVYEGGTDLRLLWGEFTQAKIDAEEADKKRKALRAQVLNLIGDSEFATVDGQPVLSYKSSKDGDSFDTKAFQDAHPDIYRQFLKSKPGIRTLREIK